ncbi:MAG: hypothetical protein K1X83_10330 [Oligoflexia bacterium]|nr:hypothetical protein [Oligoflexia bacterium]
MSGAIDRRIIFLLVLLALSTPLIMKYSIKPARMASADKFYAVIDKLQPRKGGVAFVALDFGPNTKAENLYQAQVTIEHLMRKRVPFAVFSLYVLAEPFLVSVPQEAANRLMAEFPGERWEYGKDWVNLGYFPGGFLTVQAIPKTNNLVEHFKKDARGNNLKDLPAFADARTLKDILFLGEFTGLTGMFDNYVQFFTSADYKPPFGHGCTSITIPEAYIYMDSGQLDGLLEGIAGAAWYSERLTQAFPARAKDSAEMVNTGLGVAHLVIIFLVVIGNVLAFRSGRSQAGSRA